MNWCDERWVRLYTRDTTSRLLLSFDARGLFTELLCKVDRSGVLDLGSHGVRGIAAAVRLDVQRTQIALDELQADGCLVIQGSRLVLPNFLEAQTAPQSDRVRQQESRALRRAQSLENVTNRDDLSQNVTECHAPSQPVTRGHAASRDVTPDETRRDETRLLGADKPPARQNKYRADAERAWELQETIRRDAVPGSRRLKATPERLARVEARLADGATLEDCEHVLRGYASGNDPHQWLNGETNWRRDNFDRELGRAPKTPKQTGPRLVDAAEYMRSLRGGE